MCPSYRTHIYTYIFFPSQLCMPWAMEFLLTAELQRASCLVVVVVVVPAGFILFLLLLLFSMFNMYIVHVRIINLNICRWFFLSFFYLHYMITFRLWPFVRYKCSLFNVKLLQDSFVYKRALGMILWMMEAFFFRLIPAMNVDCWWNDELLYFELNEIKLCWNWYAYS